MNELTRTTQRVIERAFPELKNTSIVANYRKMRDSNLVYGPYGKGYFIFAEVCLKRASFDVAVGGLAHELVHIAYDLKNPIKSWISDVLYPITLAREKIERATDFEVIRRGFLYELTEFTRWMNKVKPGKPISGLTLKELELLANT